jgi:hypothetical protein
MARNGSGIMSLSGANFPAVSATLIESAKYNANLNDIVSALSQSISADGQTTVTGNIPMNGNKVTGAGAATTAGDLIRYEMLFTPRDMTGYGGADITLLPGQSAFYTVTAATTLLLRIATGDGQFYSLDIAPVQTNANAGGVLLAPNNGAVSNNVYASQGNFPAGGAWAATLVGPTTAITLSAGGVGLHSLMCRIINRTVCKAVYSDYMGSTTTANNTGFFKSEWQDTTTVWSSLGTLTFNQTLTGVVRVKREM